MVFTQDFSDAMIQIQSYSNDYVMINDVKHTSSLIISPNQLITNWPPARAQAITEADLLALCTQKPDVILLGTGSKSIILPPQVLAPLLEKQYNVECMSTPAACRTFTVLSAEGRHVVAGLIIESQVT